MYDLTRESRIDTWSADVWPCRMKWTVFSETHDQLTSLERHAA